jgi:hypothetical protein
MAGHQRLDGYRGGYRTTRGGVADGLMIGFRGSLSEQSTRPMKLKARHAQRVVKSIRPEPLSLILLPISIAYRWAGATYP